MYEINSIGTNNKAKKNVVLAQGFRRRLHNIDYDHLVIALGQESNLSIIPRLEHHSFTMRTLEDAYNVRNHLKTSRNH